MNPIDTIRPVLHLSRVMDPEDQDALETAEAFLGRPANLTPEAGIAAMQQCIADLRSRIAMWEQRDESDLKTERLVELTRDLRTAQNRLREYQLQLQNRN